MYVGGQEPTIDPEDSPHFAHHALSPFDVTRRPVNFSGGPNLSELFIDGGVTPTVRV